MCGEPFARLPTEPLRKRSTGRRADTLTGEQRAVSSAAPRTGQANRRAAKPEPEREGGIAKWGGVGERATAAPADA